MFSGGALKARPAISGSAKHESAQWRETLGKKPEALKGA